MDQAIHSDFIIHWTGRDIDKEYDKCWHKGESSKTDNEVMGYYMERLKSILKYGLWMTIDEEEDKSLKELGICRPCVARTCFTELKLSETRTHAKRFGRLGIGFKRPFLFKRFGRPMNYFYLSKKPERRFFHEFYIGTNNHKDDYSLCFLKRMDKEGKGPYHFFHESEWRIIYSELIRKQLLEPKRRAQIVDLFKEPDEEFNKSLKSLSSKKRPEYLIPLGRQWFAMIIYPSLAIKVVAEADPDIRQLIENLKPQKPAREPIRHHGADEKYSKPFEIDLDACRNF